MDFLTDFVPTTIKPQEIENKSFSIIDQEIGEHPFDEKQYKIVQRIIHATADFNLGKSLIFHPDAISAGILAIQAGKNIITDVKMIQAGINKSRLEKYGVEVLNYISDEDVSEEAKRQQVTRSIIAMRKAVKLNEGGIYVIGNAPTALLELIRLIKLGEAKPDLIIGLPVGFVSVAETKEELLKITTPYITNRIRKGGSPVVAAAVNALAILAVNGPVK